MKRKVRMWLLGTSADFGAAGHLGPYMGSVTAWSWCRRCTHNQLLHDVVGPGCANGAAPPRLRTLTQLRRQMEYARSLPKALNQICDHS